MGRKNSSPVNFRPDISEIEIKDPASFSLSKRKETTSVRNFKRPQTQNKDRQETSLPDVVRQGESQLVENPPKRIGTYFGSAKPSMARASLGWDSQPKSPTAANIPFRADKSIFNKNKTAKEVKKTAEHLEMIKKLEEYKNVSGPPKLAKPKVPNDLESTHQLDSFIDSINVS